MHQILDNGISKIYKQEIRNTDTTYQLVPLDDQWQNIAEHAIQT